MNPDDLNPDSYRSPTVSFTWKPNEQSHPGQADWFSAMAEKLGNVNKHQAQLECELAYLDLVDVLIDEMTSFPEVDALLANIQK